MESIPNLSADQVKRLLRYEQLVPAVEQVLADFSDVQHGGVDQPLRATASIQHHNGFLSAMPAYVSGKSALACKLVTFYPDNGRSNKQTHMATIILFDETDGSIKAGMDGEVITAMRTAAASAVATKYLAQATHVLAVLGSGTQARSHIEAFCTMFSLKQIHIWNHRMEGADKLKNELQEWLPHETKVTAHETVEECVRDADVIVAATFATKPVLNNVPMKPWVHINSVGAPRPQWQELSSDLMNDCTVYADSLMSANAESGDVILSGAKVYAEIGQVIVGQKEAKKNQRTIFKSLGMAAEDAVSAQLVFQAFLDEQKRLSV